MPRPVAQANITTRTHRRRLAPGRQPHFIVITPSRAHLGYQRDPDTPVGRWMLRRYNPNLPAARRYSILPLGLADDAAVPDGHRILSFEQAHTAAVAAVTAPSTPDPTTLTVREAIARYIEHKEHNGQPTYELIGRANAHILPALGDLRVAALDATTLRKWHAALASSPRLLRTGADAQQAYGAAPATPDDIRRRRASANRVLTMLKAALNHAYDEGLTPSNAAWDRKLKPFPNVEVARVRYLSTAEASRLINAADPDFRPLIRAALETGARYGEITRLEVADFNPDSGTIQIRQSKSGSPRHIHLTPEGAAFFAHACTGRAPSELIFRRADGTPWKDAQQARPMREACLRAGISPLGIHQLRHTWASLSVMNGVPLLVVARNLGHTDTRMVELHYAHLASSHITEAIRAGAPRFNVELDRRVVSLR
jgi:integrase